MLGNGALVIVLLTVYRKIIVREKDTNIAQQETNLGLERRNLDDIL